MKKSEYVRDIEYLLSNSEDFDTLDQNPLKKFKSSSFRILDNCRKKGLLVKDIRRKDIDTIIIIQILFLLDVMVGHVILYHKSNLIYTIVFSKFKIFQQNNSAQTSVLIFFTSRHYYFFEKLKIVEKQLCKLNCSYGKLSHPLT